jgi:hypothetical protein
MTRINGDLDHTVHLTAGFMSAKGLPTCEDVALLPSGPYYEAITPVPGTSFAKPDFFTEGL